MQVRRREFLRKSEDNMKKAVGRATQVAVFATRIKTGHARGGWIITLGEAPVGPQDTPLDTGGSDTVLRAEQKISAFDLRTGFIIALSNNVEYILYLDQGSPTNDADNMIAQASKAALDYLRDAKYLGA
jgi:hypothetical protein